MFDDDVFAIYRHTKLIGFCENHHDAKMLEIVSYYINDVDYVRYDRVPRELYISVVKKDNTLEQFLKHNRGPTVKKSFLSKLFNF